MVDNTNASDLIPSLGLVNLELFLTSNKPSDPAFEEYRKSFLEFLRNDPEGSEWMNELDEKIACSRLKKTQTEKSDENIMLSQVRTAQTGNQEPQKSSLGAGNESDVPQPEATGKWRAH